jgi:hypothetical protein
MPRSALLSLILSLCGVRSKRYILSFFTPFFGTVSPIWRNSSKILNWSMKIDKSQIELIQELCKTSKVKSLFAFGSVTRDDFNESSDIDLVVDFDEKDPFKYTDLYFSLKTKLEDILKRQVDLLEERGIRNRLFRKELDDTKVKIYGY